MTELREMPSSLNDACRKLDVAYAENARLRAALKTLRCDCLTGAKPDAIMIEEIDAALGHQQRAPSSDLK